MIHRCVILLTTNCSQEIWSYWLSRFSLKTSGCVVVPSHYLFKMWLNFVLIRNVLIRRKFDSTWTLHCCDVIMGVSNHQPNDCLLSRSSRCRSKKTSKLRVTGLCAGTSLVTGEFPTQIASNGGNVSIWWRHRGYILDLRNSIINVVCKVYLLRLQCVHQSSRSLV